MVLTLEHTLATGNEDIPRSSVLCLTTTSTHIFAGTQAGTILVYDRVYYRRVATISAHTRAVFSLLVIDGDCIFSCSGDDTIKVYRPTFDDAKALQSGSWLVAEIGMADNNAGDLYSMAWDELSRTLFIGNQNTSIQVSTEYKPLRRYQCIETS